MALLFQSSMKQTPSISHLRHYQARGFPLRPVRFGRCVRLSNDAPEQLEQSAAVIGIDDAKCSHRLFDASQDDGRVALEGGAAVLTGLEQERFQGGCEPFGWKRRGPMFVDHAARCRLERGGERGRGFADVVVEDRVQIGRLVARQEAVHHEKNLRLPVVEVARELHEQGDVALLLPDQRRRWMLARGGEVRAIARTANLGQPLRSAADRANLMTERRAGAPRFPLAAEGTHHNALLYNYAHNPSIHRNAPCTDLGDPMVRRESVVEYFKELVDEALAHQSVVAGELTAFYVVQLLAGFLQRPAEDDAPLALRLFRALESGGLRQRASLKQIGDVSLFMSGFFSDSFRRKLVDVDYYVNIGGSAYTALSRHEVDTFSPVFAELADKFVDFVDVLSEVSERSSCGSNTDLLRLYERWLRTGSSRSGQLLVERGVVPNASLAATRIQ